MADARETLMTAQAAGIVKASALPVAKAGKKGGVDLPSSVRVELINGALWSN